VALIERSDSFVRKEKEKGEGGGGGGGGGGGERTGPFDPTNIRDRICIIQQLAPSPNNFKPRQNVSHTHTDNTMCQVLSGPVDIRVRLLFCCFRYLLVACNSQYV